MSSSPQSRLELRCCLSVGMLVSRNEPRPIIGSTACRVARGLLGWSRCTGRASVGATRRLRAHASLVPTWTLLSPFGVPTREGGRIRRLSQCLPACTQNEGMPQRLRTSYHGPRTHSGRHGGSLGETEDSLRQTIARRAIVDAEVTRAVPVIWLSRHSSRSSCSAAREQESNCECGNPLHSRSLDFFRPRLEKFIRVMRIMTLFQVSPERIRLLAGAHPEFLNEVHGTLVKRHGSVESYLREACGIEQDTLQRLKDRLLSD
ncbi:uncharacterized protein STAUR_7865 [Stigmatella aurantiaca DW4/3-1]|uniref:Protein-tyrosine-phosphatase n=2 Tax=Stigmatella aurantiaca TaxID=41 RepID=E3FNE7_STIAD|nr:uncharacterized protein STAUR_7865 [Stigmatella aurantiaca DW4/3-1]